MDLPRNAAFTSMRGETAAINRMLIKGDPLMRSIQLHNIYLSIKFPWPVTASVTFVCQKTCNAVRQPETDFRLAVSKLNNDPICLECNVKLCKE